MSLRLVVAAVVVGAAAGAAAQQSAVEQFYRWTDQEGRNHITDTPPPPGAKNVRRPRSAGVEEKDKAAEATAKPGAKPDPAVPFAVQRAVSQFPVTLYTAPNCSQPCAVARDLLNKRGVPFTEVQVFDEPGVAELKRLSGAEEVPVVKVGASVYSGFQRSAYDALLDSAGYPAVGILPSRAQAAPAPPEGYTLNPPTPPKAAPIAPADAPAAGSGPYSPK